MKRTLLIAVFSLGFSAVGFSQFVTTDNLAGGFVTTDDLAGGIIKVVGHTTGKPADMVKTNDKVTVVPGEFLKVHNDGVTKTVINRNGALVGEIVVIDELVEGIKVKEVDENEGFWVDFLEY
ncbi:MAG: hypothetical protein COC01_08925 [Bacteroidetes bacterium]|nr:MAG: hypothetical protein COC01_08925 [Bacteroidota bacterium]